MSVTVPTSEEFDNLAERVTNLSSGVSGLTDTVSALSNKTDECSGAITAFEARLGAQDAAIDVQDEILSAHGANLDAQANAIITLNNDLTALGARVSALETAGGGTTSPRPRQVRPEDYGAVPGTDCTAAFNAMMLDLEGHTRTDGGGGVPLVQSEIILSGGEYRLSESMFKPATGRVQGLTVRGLGKRTSEIVQTNAANPILVQQDRWMGVRFHDLSFRSAVAGGRFMYSYSTGAGQDFGFDNCEWRGTWEYGIGLDGNNTNSEMFWNNCHINGSYNIAFLYGGMNPDTLQQDQFLNYWFNDCKVEFDWGTFIRMDRGGYIKCDGGSYIIKGTKPGNATSRFFEFPIAGHYDSVQKLAVRDIRFELRNAYSQVIQSNWTGEIVFDGCSDTALGFQSHSPNLIAHEYTNPGIVTYRNCDLVGKHAYHAPAVSGRQRAIYDGCLRKNNRTKATFLVTDGANAASLKFSHRDDGDGII